MREVIQNVYYYSELSDSAKQYVRDNYGDMPFYDGWWLDAYDHFIRNVKKEYGVELEVSEIEFSGFGSQSDGASIEHVFSDDEISAFMDAVGIKFKHGLKNAFIAQLGDVKLKRVSFDCHKSCTHAYVGIYGDSEHGLINEYFEDKADELEEALEEWKDDMCDKIFYLLSEENDYREDEDFFSDYMDGNDFEFYKNGEMYKGE